MKNYSDDEIVQAVSWQLKISNTTDDQGATVKKIWSNLAGDPNFEILVSMISRSLAEILKRALAYKLGLLRESTVAQKELSYLDALWKLFTKWSDEEDRFRSLHLIHEKVNAALEPSLLKGANPSVKREAINLTREELTSAIRWKLGIPTEMDSRRDEDVWLLFAQNPGHKEQLDRIIDSLSLLLEEPIACRLGGRSSDYGEKDSSTETFGKCFDRWLVQTPSRKLLVEQHIRKALTEIRNRTKVVGSQLEVAGKASDLARQDATKTMDSSRQVVDTGTKSTALGQLKQSEVSSLPQAASAKSVEDSKAKMFSENEGRKGAENRPTRKVDGPLVVTVQWKYLPVPNEPDSHTESYNKFAGTPEGLNIIGARVRGKKHKHEGTNCDDWFEFTISGPWTIIAVSDGAGSKKFSRVGARVSCQTAVKQLAAELESHRIKQHEALDTFLQSLRRNEADGTFVGDDLEFVQKALHRAMLAAYEAVKASSDERQNSLAHYKALGDRPLEINDLSATLLLAVHTTIKHQESDYDFVLACQVGDGMMAALDQKKMTLTLLSEPDSGAFSGETDFLTSRKKLERDNLWRKTRGFFGRLQALMVMTDGVADDYFPNDPGIWRLYGDLVINQVLDLRWPPKNEIASALKNTKLCTFEDLVRTEFDFIVETITENGPQKARIRSVATYAEKLGLSSAQDVATSPALLVAGAYGDPLWKETSPDTKLRAWLDSYYVKGSFDDRTLVVLYRKDFS